MKKVATLNDVLYKRVTNWGPLGKELRDLLGIPVTKKMGIGDTTVRLGEPSTEKDVYKNVQNGKEIFYVVATPIDKDMAVCYSIYPK